MTANIQPFAEHANRTAVPDMTPPAAPSDVRLPTASVGAAPHGEDGVHAVDASSLRSRFSPLGRSSGGASGEWPLT